LKDEIEKNKFEKKKIKKNQRQKKKRSKILWITIVIHDATSVGEQ
jgi:hypothetical protein